MAIPYQSPDAPDIAFAARELLNDEVVQLQQELRPGAATVARVEADVVSVTLLEENTDRLGAIFYNDADLPAFVKFGATAAADDFTHKIQPGDRWELPLPAFMGRIDAVWATTADGVSGGMQVTELIPE